MLRSCPIYHATVGNYLSWAKEAGLTYIEVKEMDDDKLKHLLKGDRAEKEKELHIISLTVSGYIRS